MSTLHLDQLDEFTLARIAKKFTAIPGVRFYRCCRAAKYVVDRLKPEWPPSDSGLTYSNNRRAVYGSTIAIDEQDRWYRKDVSARIPAGYCSIECVSIVDCNSEYLKVVVLPELENVGAVKTLRLLTPRPLDEVSLLLDASNPATVEIWDSHYDAADDVFKDVKSLQINVTSGLFRTYWTTAKAFELAKNKKHLTFSFNTAIKEFVSSFLKKWLKGKSTGSLERLTVIQECGWWSQEKKQCIQNDTESLLTCYVKTDEGYVVEREGLNRMRVRVQSDANFLRVDFHLQ